MLYVSPLVSSWGDFISRHVIMERFALCYMRKEKFAAGERYHIYNRGTGKMDIFHDDSDRHRLLTIMRRYLFNKAGERLVDIAAFVLMPNHFHIALQEQVEGGISRYLKSVSQAYAQYFNTKYSRSGTFFSGRFNARHVATTVYFLHLTRYIHRNPLAITGATPLEKYPWSSYPTYLELDRSPLVTDDAAMRMFKSPEEYQNFVKLWRSGEDEFIGSILVD